MARRERNEVRDDGLYSAVGGRTGPGVGVGAENLNINVFLVFDAARDRIAVRCGVLFAFGIAEL